MARPHPLPGIAERKDIVPQEVSMSPAFLGRRRAARALISQIRRFLLFFDGFEGTRGWGAQIHFPETRRYSDSNCAQKTQKVDVFHTFSLSGSNPRFH